MNKEDLRAHALSIIQLKIEKLRHLIADTRASNSETKSSMGDKYETGREMLQQSIDKLEMQLAEQNRVFAEVQKLSTTAHTVIHLGSIVHTANHLFYISASLGEMNFGGQKIYAVSAASPVAKAMWSKKRGDSFLQNGTEVRILEIY